MSAFKIAAIILCCAALAFSITMLVRMVKMTKGFKAEESQKSQEKTTHDDDADA